MEEETNDIIPPEKKLPASLDTHLRAILPEKELNQFREQLPAEFLSDASEGLDHLEDLKQLESVLQQINQQMHHQLAFKKLQRKRRSIGDLSWTYWAIIIIFILIFTGFIVIRMLLKH
jgi:hypothetical protein